MWGEEKEGNISFVGVPCMNATVVEVEARLRRVCLGCLPIISTTNHINEYFVRYNKKSTVTKMFDLLKSMGWNVTLQDGGILCILTKENPSISPSLGTDVYTDAFASNTSPEESAIVREVSKEPYIIPCLKVVDPYMDLISKEEVKQDIFALYEETELFQKLSPETQKEILSIIREDWKKQNPELYAKQLLFLYNSK